MQKLQLQWNANCKCGQLFILGFIHSAENIQARHKKKLSKEQGNQTRKKFTYLKAKRTGSIAADILTDKTLGCTQVF